MGHITMSRKEREQLIVFRKIEEKRITHREAAMQLNVTERCVRKKIKRYREFGAAGLTHKSRDRPSSNRWCSAEKTLTIELLKSEWIGFGPSFTSEQLAKLKDIKVSKETVRQTMIAEGIWKANQKKAVHRKRRERRAVVGMLVQLDGSPHDWFEGRAAKCTLLVFIDDATSKILWLEFVKSESNIDVIRATKNYILKFGRPHEFYVDFGSVFSVNLNNPERDKKTQWERILKELLIGVIHAHSPQAKGRVERANKTLQDRLVKEMRLAKINSIEMANNFLQTTNFIAEHNQRFAVNPAQAGDAHRPIETYNLDEIFCLKEARILANDYTILYQKQLYQIHEQQGIIVRPKDTITIKTYLDGSIKIGIRKTSLSFSRINFRQKPQQQEIKIVTNTFYKPSANSRRWVNGLPPLAQNDLLKESRVKSAAPAVEAS